MGKESLRWNIQTLALLSAPLGFGRWSFFITFSFAQDGRRNNCRIFSFPEGGYDAGKSVYYLERLFIGGGRRRRKGMIGTPQHKI